MKINCALIIYLSLLILGSCVNPKDGNDSKIELGTPKELTELSKEPNKMINQVLNAMGGVKKWEDLKYISWSFFGARHLVWDKLNDRVRIENPENQTVFLLDMRTNTGRFKKDSIELTDKELLSEKLSMAKSIWINDGYWLFMPFKLNDPGVKVNYEREDTIGIDTFYSVFTLNFNSVGDTPENKYEIFVDHKDHLIKRWNYFKESNQDTADASWPWDNYQDYNGLLLSSDRSDNKGPSNVRIYESLDDKVFTSFESFEYY